MGVLDFLACWLHLKPIGFMAGQWICWCWRCLLWRVVLSGGPRIFPVWVCSTAKIPQEFPGNEGAECTCSTSFLSVVTVQAHSVIESGIYAICFLLPQLPDTPPSSAATTHLIPSNPNFPSTAYLILRAFRCRSDWCLSLRKHFRRHAQRSCEVPHATASSHHT